MKKRFLAIFLTLAMVLALMPTTAAADSDFTIDGGELTKYNGSGGDVTIPAGVTSIGNSAFSECYSLTSVTIPDGVTSIGEDAFAGCYSLTSITIPDSVTRIGDGAFSGCNSLDIVDIPDGVTSIEANAFYGCNSLTDVTISDSVTSIGDAAFRYCSVLTSVVIGNGVTSIGDGAFQGCTSLTGVTIPSSVTSIGDGAFSYCSGLTSVTIPDSVTSIGSEAFSRCSGLTSVDIPDSVTSIGDRAFQGCSGLTSVDIPDSVTSIGDAAFEDCTSLTDVTIGNGVTGIGFLTFEGCTSLTSVIIGNGVTSIGESAFYGCGNLTDVTIGNGVTSIGLNVFYRCARLTSIVIPSSVTSIRNGAFDSCTGLTSVTFLGNCPTIGSAFSDTSSLEKIRYPYLYEDTGWNVKIPADLGAAATVQLKAYGDPELSGPTETVTPDEDGNYSVTITSQIPFDPTGGVDTRNYTISDENFSLKSVSLSNADKSATLKLAKIGTSDAATLSARAGSTFGITVAEAAFISTVDLENADGSRVSLSPISVSVDESTPDPDPVTPDPDPVTPGPDPVTPDPDPVTPDSDPVTPDPDPVTPSTSGSSGTSSRPSSTSKIPELKPSPIQDDAIRKDRKEIPDWINRLELPGYARTFYDVMAGNTFDSHTADGKKQGVFEVEQNFVLPKPAGGDTARVDWIEIVEFSMMDVYSAGGKLQSTLFEDEKFYRVSADAGDGAVNYADLSLGSVVKTSAFNGVFVTKIPYDSTFNDKKKEACEYIAAVFQAFDRDHPEIFWLSGKCKARIMVVTDPKTSAKEAYFFLVLADKDGFTMCSPDWTAAGAITAGIARREAVVAEILATVTAGGTAGKVKQLNKWLTEHNQYNTTPDLTSIGNEPHECLAALEGRIGRNGPVCDGYARAFKVLCDRLSIPCVLETGWAKAQANSEPGFHMWNLVQIGGSWYGTDITWNDPSVKGIVAAISGRENENYLLIGTGTVVRSLTFGQSHVVQDQAVSGGVNFNNGPVLSPIAYSGLSAGEFADVPADAYYYNGVRWAVDRGITAGTSETTFSPDAPCTQVQILTFLWRSAGKPASTAQLPFALNKGLEYAGDALGWAYQNGMIDGSFDQTAPCTRADAVKFIWQADGSPAASGSVFADVPADAGYAQAVAWAVAKKVTEGTSATTFAPDQVCSRAHIVTFLCRDRA